MRYLLPLLLTFLLKSIKSLYYEVKFPSFEFEIYNLKRCMGEINVISNRGLYSYQIDEDESILED